MTKQKPQIDAMQHYVQSGSKDLGIKAKLTVY